MPPAKTVTKKGKKDAKQKRKNGNYNFTGAKNNNAKLTEAEVKKMRALFKNGFSLDILSLRFKRPRNTVRNIVYGQTWRHIL